MAGIFISYRRTTSKHLARSIFMALQQRGHDVFLDVNSIDAGAFDHIIRNQIAARPHFLLLLSSGALERCANPDDWLLKEIQEAVRLKRNIVPVYDEGFDFNTEKKYLPEALQHYLALQNAPPFVHYYFDAFIQTLSDRFFKDSVADVPVAPTPLAERAEVQKRIQQAAQPPNDGWTPQIESTEPPQPVSPAQQAELNGFMRRAAQFTPATETPQPAPPAIWGVENILPAPFEWVYIPPGEVTFEINKKIETYSVSAFNISKYPITNEQFNRFVQSEDGYSNPLWWDDTVDSRDWRSKHTELPVRDSVQKRSHPVEKVAWYEAVAFCKWLAQRFNAPAPNLPPVIITLPTEPQWVRAAQGSDQRDYPWGMEFDLNRCNIKTNRIGRTTPVTQYPNGASLYGVMDMAGNVFEMLLDGGSSPEYCGIRGGSWQTDASRARLTYREEVSVVKRLDGVGFRIVLINTP